MYFHITLCITLCSSSFAFAAESVRYQASIKNRKCCTVIAHAAGAINGNAVTNSKEALLANIALGTRFFEIDFSPTSDGKLAATHDWDHWRLLTGRSVAGAPTSAQFITTPLVARHSGHGVPGRYQSMMFTDLEKFALLHRNIKVVTDTKYDLNMIVEAVRESPARKQFIVQAYSFDDVDALVAAGLKGQIALTIYKMPVAYDEKNHFHEFSQGLTARSQDLVALVIPASFAMRGNLEKLRMIGVPVLVHGQPNEINSRQLHEELKARGATGFFLD